MTAAVVARDLLGFIAEGWGLKVGTLGETRLSREVSDLLGFRVRDIVSLPL